MAILLSSIVYFSSNFIRPQVYIQQCLIHSHDLFELLSFSGYVSDHFELFCLKQKGQLCPSEILSLQAVEVHTGRQCWLCVFDKVQVVLLFPSG